MILTIDKLVAGGEGMARHEGRVAFVAGVLPGEEVEIEVTQTRKDFARGRLLRVLQASPDRVEPPCPLAGTCGGCDWQHISTSAQARLKIEIVQDALRRTGGLEFPGLQIESGPALGYRNRLQLHTDGSGSVGFLERGGHGFVKVDACPVSHPAFASLFKDGCAPNAPERFLAFAAEAVDGTAQVWREDQNPHAEVRLTLLEREFVFPLRGFFQSNLALLPRLLTYSLDGLSGDTIFDLYAGVGLFGALARAGFQRVVCVESNREALECAKKNVGMQNAVFVSGRLEQVVSESKNILQSETQDVIVVDPPREGLAHEVRKYLQEQKASRLIYVSCNPVTLARDLKDLLAGNYTLEDMRLFDFFPHTSHVEAVAKLGSGDPR